MHTIRFFSLQTTGWIVKGRYSQNQDTLCRLTAEWCCSRPGYKAQRKVSIYFMSQRALLIVVKGKKNQYNIEDKVMSPYSDSILILQILKSIRHLESKTHLS